MPFSVLQTDLTEPSEKQLRQAFEALPELTDEDAAWRARDAVGLLAQRLTHESATTLLRALEAAAIPAAIVDENDLPSLPAQYETRRVDCDAQGITLYDSLNRPMPWSWEQVKVVAIGWVRLHEFVADHPQSHMIHAHRGPRYSTLYLTEHYTDEHLHVRPVLEIHVAGEPHRYHVDGDAFASSNPATRGIADEDQRFAALVHDVLKGANQAVVNRGAEALMQRAKHRLYRSEQIFEQELIWLRWLVNQG